MTGVTARVHRAALFCEAVHYHCAGTNRYAVREITINPMPTAVSPLPRSPVRKAFWAVAFFYGLIAFEFFYMTSPFAAYFYSVYRPGLDFLNAHPRLAWLSATFLPHAVVDTQSAVLNLARPIGATLAAIGFGAFVVTAGQIYYARLRRRGLVRGGLYRYVRHPQYTAFAVCGLGLLLLWPRLIGVAIYETMLFAYLLLARAEEHECEDKFGDAYRDYQRRTAMFLPGMPRALARRLPASSPRGIALAALYGAALASALGLAFLGREWMLRSLYATYTPGAAWISVARIPAAQLDVIAALVSRDAGVQSRLGGPIAQLNYVVPVSWYVPEIPMHPVGTGDDHAHPSNFDPNSYKVIVTAASLRQPATGPDILRYTTARTPLAEVEVDLRRALVTAVNPPPLHPRYEGVPVPLF
jgi:protein-S-isoprenylcysteine O-methyltransferase Ste14